jgi:hypothetical protein
MNGRFDALGYPDFVIPSTFVIRHSSFGIPHNDFHFNVLKGELIVDQSE